MHLTMTRYSFPFVFIHWVLILISLALLGLGWYVQFLPQTASNRTLFLNLHFSLGLTGALLIVFQIILLWWNSIRRAPLQERAVRSTRTIIADSVCILVYACLVIIAASGLVQAAASDMPLQFWGLSIPVGEVNSSKLADFSGILHRLTAWLLAVLVVIHIGFVFFPSFQKSPLVPETAPEPLPPSGYSPEPKTGLPVLSKATSKLVKGLRRWGWFTFWIQSLLALVSALLLMFAGSGLSLSPGQGVFGNGLFWGTFGFGILCLAIIIAFYYPRLSRKIALNSDFYLLSPRKKLAFWFLNLGTVTNFIGVSVALLGVLSSTTLLIAKVVSQPPGIAITDPSKIVRSLDVFLLLVNFSLLTGHLIGTLVSYRLTALAAKARRRAIV